MAQLGQNAAHVDMSKLDLAAGMQMVSFGCICMNEISQGFEPSHCFTATLHSIVLQFNTYLALMHYIVLQFHTYLALMYYILYGILYTPNMQLATVLRLLHSVCYTRTHPGSYEY